MSKKKNRHEFPIRSKYLELSKFPQPIYKSQRIQVIRELINEIESGHGLLYRGMSFANMFKPMLIKVLLYYLEELKKK